MARVNTQQAFKAWQEGKRCHPANSIWTDGARLISYGTEIARVNGESIAFNGQRYSATTSTQQNGLLYLLRGHVKPVIVYETEEEYRQAVNG